MDSRKRRLRIIDANLNRASEGLRVAEDVCRFHWGLAGFAAELKELRHSLLTAGERVAGARTDLLRARDIEGDVGRGQEAVASAKPADLGCLAHRNLQRVCEAVRVLEEASTVEDAEALRAFAAIRYRAYAVEKGLAALSNPSERAVRLRQARLYLLATSTLCRGDLLETVRRALAAGVDAVQLREKGVADRLLLGRARALRELTARAGVLFIVNDRPDVALLVHADGVHLGQHDLPVGEVRSLLGYEHLIGVSTHSLEEARRAAREGADYIGAGPVFATETKDAGPLLGLDGLRSVVVETSLPVFAIGGIGLANVEAVQGCGARRLAVSSAVLASADVEDTVSRLRAAIDVVS